MKVFKDLITDDELFSDSYPMTEQDGTFYEVTGKLTYRTTDIDDSLIGGNASADAPEERAEASSESGINIVLNHKLVEVDYDKKSFIAWLKGYSKAILEKIEDKAEADKFKNTITNWAKDIVKNIDDYNFFTGESLNPNGMILPVKYEDDNATVKMIFIKQGLKEVKY